MWGKRSPDGIASTRLRIPSATKGGQRSETVKKRPAAATNRRRVRLRSTAAATAAAAATAKPEAPATAKKAPKKKTPKATAAEAAVAGQEAGPTAAASPVAWDMESPAAAPKKNTIRYMKTRQMWVVCRDGRYKTFSEKRFGEQAEPEARAFLAAE